MEDELLATIAAYVHDGKIESERAFDTAALSLADSLGCAILALGFEECRRRLGPLVEGTVVPNGCRVPGTSLVLDPVQGAFAIGSMIRWLDYNDTWLAAEWGHPSDNLGGLLAVADFVSRGGRVPGLAANQGAGNADRAVNRGARSSGGAGSTGAGSAWPADNGVRPVSVRRLLEAEIKAYEIQGVLSLENSFNRVGLDHVILVKAATAAVAAWLLGGDRTHISAALSNAWIDGGPLRTYRHAPNTGVRKSWAAGDAASRGVRLAMMALSGEPGYDTALSAPRWGFYDALFKGAPFRLPRPFGSLIAENILFKLRFPAEFHAQTAVECAVRLHELVRDRLDEITGVRIRTQESALRIIDKRGPLRNPADRDHCLQYAVAVALINGGLKARDYEDEAARDPRIDALRERMTVVEDAQYTRDYLDPEKRSIANAIQVTFRDGSRTPEAAVEYPLGHPRRREEGIPALFEKLRENLSGLFPPNRVEAIVETFKERVRLERLSVPELLELFRK